MLSVDTQANLSGNGDDEERRNNEGRGDCDWKMKICTETLKLTALNVLTVR